MSNESANGSRSEVRHDLDEAAILHTAQARRLRVFNERCIIGAVSASAGIALTAWVLFAAGGWVPALQWALLISTIEAAILFVGMRCRRSIARAEDSAHWKFVHFALAGFAGLAWGSSVWFAWKDGDNLPYLATITILVGVAGVSTVTMASYAWATVLFFCGIYLLPLVHFALHTGPITPYLEAGLTVALLVQLGYTRELGKVVLSDVDQHARNAALVNRLNELIIHDQLTDAYSRGHTFARMEQLVSTRLRYGSCACAIMFDLDHFKVINDTYGHPAGDRALREVALAVAAQLRDDDVLGRIGGEEFLVLLPMSDIAAALLLGERLRKTLTETFITEGTQTVYLPASFGVAELQSSESHSEWFRRVDGALYQAKERGRNAVVAAP